MHVTIVHVHVKTEHIDDFIVACKENHLSSIQEKGNFRFDVMQQDQDSSRFVLYESYQNENAAKAHKDTNHYLKWRETVADWMASPRQGILHRGLFPISE